MYKGGGEGKLGEGGKKRKRGGAYSGMPVPFLYLRPGVNYRGERGEKGREKRGGKKGRGLGVRFSILNSAFHRPGGGGKEKGTRKEEETSAFYPLAWTLPGSRQKRKRNKKKEKREEGRPSSPAGVSLVAPR